MAKPVKFGKKSRKSGKRRRVDTSFDFGYNLIAKKSKKGKGGGAGGGS